MTELQLDPKKTALILIDLQNAIVGGVRTALGYVPSSWLPGGTPDPLIDRRVTLGTQQSRVEGPDKVKGAARFAAEVPMERLLYAACVYSTIARGKISELDIADAEAAPGVALVMTHRNAPKMALPPPIGLTNLKAAQPALFEGLRPVIAIREGGKPGTVELRLVAGPLANANAAARLCASLDPQPTARAPPCHTASASASSPAPCARALSVIVSASSATARVSPSSTRRARPIAYSLSPASTRRSASAARTTRGAP